MKSPKELSEALQAMIDGKNTMCVPADEERDEDLILARAISEHDKMRRALEEIVQLAVEGQEVMRHSDIVHKIISIASKAL